MARLIVTTDSAAAGAIRGAGLGDLVIAIERRLVWGTLPSDAERQVFFSPRTTQPNGLHWLDDTPAWRLEGTGLKGRGLIDLLSECDTAELWMGPEPNAQLLLLWLLDHLSSEDGAASKLSMRHLDFAVGGVEPEQLAKLNPHMARLTQHHLALAGRAWCAYCEPTPQAWFELLKIDLGLLPQLERCAVDVLSELPSVTTGLGATETRMLELIAPGNVQPFDVFPGHKKPNERRVFDYWEVGELLDGLARCPMPAVAGLDEGPFTLDMHDDVPRHARYKQSQLSFTDLGQAVLARAEDFRRHNPIRRWWGGTLLTNERLWRWDRESRMLIAPD
ncbi:hypothetical protein C7U92_05775 [Bradyrhizobium sp. WBOS7]|uniref:DUF1835 domain-containing protein n=1 Tax=Bradyrhizobium betae TaxID=244734 RepID=A0AAE9NGB0_9BRAD|nr:MULTISPECIES: hypothetical protein [Bradyrhizobium]MDD1569126.1 hypothetical protein [Bradyrhizobium sp. WBOS1]UUO37935.1 hypothetical protein DCK84_27385 [Bradyrhizobium sp. WBOS01]MDD1527099.1 hypothetical protein [Bradyrhizobium sp. WBOS2]MDD1576245.1 hypothetical protein [Bradyrhizobium sp. WBOS7]MDD1602499.1 hypothetical protein [Bradyrhizobium sp. WBOS16]